MPDKEVVELAKEVRNRLKLNSIYLKDKDIERVHSNMNEIDKLLVIINAALADPNCENEYSTNELAVMREISNNASSRLELVRSALDCAQSLAVINAESQMVVEDVVPVSSNANCTQSASLVQSSSVLKVKPMELLKFNGDYKTWRPFWEQFASIIHRAPISGTEKFAYLMSLTSGRAHRVLEGFSMDAESYDRAVNLLQERFGNPDRLVQAYEQELRNLNPVDDSSSQRNNLDIIRRILTNLKTIEYNVEQENVKKLILGKFGRDTAKQVVRSLGSRYTTEELMNALAEEVKVEESVDLLRNNATPSTSNSSLEKSNHHLKRTAAALVSGGVNKGASGSGYSNNTNCVFCGNSHKSPDCRKFSTLASRKSRLAARKLCYSCLSNSHVVGKCGKKDEKCEFCGKSGHALHLCVAYMLRNKKPRTAENETTTNNKDTGIFLQTFLCRCSSTYIRGLIDSGSRDSYIKRSILNVLNVKPKSYENIYICPFGTTEPINFSSSNVNLKLTNLEGKISRNFELRTTPYITGNIETTPILDTTIRSLPEHRKYADPQIFLPESERKPIDILVGSDQLHNILTGETQRLNTGVVLVNSIFGWIPSGKIENNSTFTHNTYIPSSVLVCATPTLDEQVFDPSVLVNLWDLESLGIKSSECDNIDDLVLENFRSTVRFEENRYIVRWPWKVENPTLLSNFRMSLARLKSLFQRSPLEILTKCDKLFKEQLSLDIIEKAPSKTPYLTHYLPHRPIFRNDKIRVVYDASAKTKTGHSLNDMLHCGPALQENLVGLLLNFRLNSIALTADIEKAFLQLGLNEVDRDVVRFLWVKDLSAPITPDNLIFYRFKRVPFGVVSSPFLLNIVLQEHLSTPPLNKWNLIAKSKFYVDNLVISVNNVSSAVDLYDTLTKKLQDGGFRLRDWTSNNEDFLKVIPPSNLSTSKGDTISILGLNWNRHLDVLNIKINTDDPPSIITKRFVLSFVASIYDPLGLFVPSVLSLKLLIQECWKDKFDWDKSLPPLLVAKWLKLYLEALDIPKVIIPRKLWPFEETGNISLHVFCDASKNAYACAAYLCYENLQTSERQSILIYSRVRITPVKSKESLTIPRLELLAVLIGKRVSNFLTTLLNVSLTNTILWTDATTVLQWINSTALLPKFVQNRVNEIRKTPNRTIRYVPTSDNPADIATRGMRASYLQNYDLWWHGPSWLTHERLWPSTPENTKIISTPVLVAGSVSYTGVLTDTLEKRFSSWDSFVRLFIALLSFLFVKSSTPLSNVEKTEEAEKRLILELQRKYFSSEILSLKKGLQPNFQLNLFLDSSGLIRCKGRLQNVSFPWDTINPILLPRNSPICETLIRKIHEENFHIGCNHVLAKLREKFWVVKGRAKVKSVIHKCVKCRKVDGGSYQLPPMPPLPLVRVAEVSPFLHTGLDFLGPLYIRKGEYEEDTVYVAIFVCLVTRAIHLELVRNLSGNEFLLSLTRFISRRGSPKIIISDNARNFIFAQPLVSEKVTSLNAYIDKFSTSYNIKWKFIPSYSPWQGGAYERLVAVVKSCVRKSFREVLLDYVELNTALCQIENVVNGRPLTYVGEELLSPLTPNNFLRLRTFNVNGNLDLPDTPISSSTRNLIRGWEDVNAVTEKFWVEFRSHYLLSLREKHSSVHPKPRNSLNFTPTIGTVVLIKESSAPRTQWSPGVIIGIHSRNSLADVRRPDGKILERISVNRLFPLELPSESSK